MKRRIVSERKIKHWQGYGTVDARVISKKPDELVIRVSGNHEYGLDCDKYDTYRVYEWLVKRFDPSKKESDIASVDIDDRYERVGNIDQEVCDYTIKFGTNDRWTGRMWQESTDETLKDIERTYGKEVADALVKYCKVKRTTVDKVVSDMTGDGNGMTAWDKFDSWAQKTLGLDIMGNFDDTYDWTGADELERDRFGQVYQEPTDFSTMNEGSGSRMDEYAISDRIWEYLRDCEWVEDMDARDGDILLTVDGRDYAITVEPEIQRMKKLGMDDDEMKGHGFDVKRQTWKR